MKNASILVVDDSLIVRAHLSKQLKQLGYSVVLAVSGTEALQTLQAQSVDCMLLDLHMDGMTGYDVLAHLKQAGTAAPVIVLSADMQVASRLKAIDLGAREFLKKPPNLDEIQTVIENVLRK